eukprot:502964_1
MGTCSCTSVPYEHVEENTKIESNTEAKTDESTTINVKVIYNKRIYKWSRCDEQFASLQQFVKQKHKIKAKFKLEYMDCANNRKMIKNDNDLQTALENAINEGKSELKIQAIIDFDIFEMDSTECHQDYICQCADRIINAMQYYQTLNIDTDKDKLIIFCEEIYPHILNDFTHVISKHPNTLDRMYDFAINYRDLDPCNAQNCLKERRHNRNREEKEEKEEYKQQTDIQFYVKRDMMDAVHCYILH